MTIKQGIIHKLFIKSNKGLPMREPPANQMHIMTGYGIEGDQNAHPWSPRQILLTHLEQLESLDVQPGALRENMSITGLSLAEFVPGAVLQIGEQVKIRLTFYCEPCRRIGHLGPSLKELVEKRGILGVAISGGRVAVGDAVHSLPRRSQALSPIPYERFLMFLSQVPPGKVVTYKQVTLGMGVAESYVRAIPRYISLAKQGPYPVHRIVDSAGCLLMDYIENQARLLTQENIELLEEPNIFGTREVLSVNLRQHGWLESPLYTLENL